MNGLCKSMKEIWVGSLTTFKHDSMRQLSLTIEFC